ncbi:methyl-accepting chemotaxis protein [Desulfitobacterium sp. THU1]|uniref:methyl-accepting chemotaxis protein n=1 Tax=Desulfitobacterium sp. THU1 TaxID=3138072 RepID=UPI00311E6CF2
MKSIKTRLIMAFIFTSALMGIVVGGYTIYSQFQVAESNTQAYRETLYEEYDRGIKTDVEIAISLIEEVYQEQVAGLLSEDEARKKAADLIRGLRFDDGNYYWIDTTTGVNVVYLGQDTEGKSRNDSVDSNGFFFIRDGLIKTAVEQGGGFTDYLFPRPGETEPLPKRGYTQLFKPYGWVVGTGNWINDIEEKVVAHEQFYQDQMRSNISRIAIAMLIGLLAVAIFAYRSSQKMAKQVNLVAQGANEIAHGNLTIERIVVDSEDELGRLAQDFNLMRDNLIELVKQVSMSSEHVASSTQQLSAGAEQSAQAANEVAASIMEVAKGTEKQMDAVNDVAAIVEEMSASMENMLNNTKHVVGSAEGTAQAAIQGHQSINTTIEAMRTIQTGMNHTTSLVEQLGVRSLEIGRIVEVISGIASQTNLLSLNAAIEAARAGEQGRGFAVVAEEVRKLAEQSQVAAKQIAELIGQVQVDTNNVVEAMRFAQQGVESGAKVTDEAGKTFNEIAQLIEEVTEQVKGMSQEIEQVAAGSERIGSAIHQVDQISQAIAGQTQNVSASTEEQSASVEEIASSSQVLARMTEEMNQAIRKFKI